MLERVVPCLDINFVSRLNIIKLGKMVTGVSWLVGYWYV